MNTDAKIKAMLKAKCSVLGCDKPQFTFMGLPSKINDVQETFPFCEEHSMKIMMREMGVLRLKNGNIYKQEKGK